MRTRFRSASQAIAETLPGGSGVNQMWDVVLMHFGTVTLMLAVNRWVARPAISVPRCDRGDGREAGPPPRERAA